MCLSVKQASIILFNPSGNWLPPHSEKALWSSCIPVLACAYTSDCDRIEVVKKIVKKFLIVLGDFWLSPASTTSSYFKGSVYNAFLNASVFHILYDLYYCMFLLKWLMVWSIRESVCPPLMSSFLCPCRYGGGGIWSRCYVILRSLSWETTMCAVQ